MREVTAQESHICEYCKETIKIGEQCVQAASSPYGRFWHTDCSPNKRQR